MSEKLVVDINVDTQYGDTGKGKVTNELCKRGYDAVVRYNGGANAGHTIYHNGEKIITHMVPACVLHGIPSIIGPGCVVNPQGFMEEVQDLQEKGIDTEGKLFIAHNAHIVTNGHLQEDNGEKKIGTTGRGIGPAYRDKHARKGKRAEDVPELSSYIVNFHEFMFDTGNGEKEVLFEGAQGFGLDIDHGDYPYVTSSHPTVAGALLNGIPHQAVRDVWGVAKIYETYVGSKEFELGSDEDKAAFEKIRERGNEYGATTGRERQVNWFNRDLFRQAMSINGVTQLVVNKVDVLREAGAWKSRNNRNEVTDHRSEEAMKDMITKLAKVCVPDLVDIYFSESPETI